MRALLVVFVVCSFLFSGSCEKKLFNLKAMAKQGQGVTIRDILRDLSLECDLSILFEDPYAKKKIDKPLDFVNIKNYTFKELLDFLLSENDLFYSYYPAKSLLKIAYYKTKSFNIDYINLSSMVSESKKSIVLGTTTQNGDTTGGLGGGGEIGGEEGGSGEASDYTTITTKSEFTFWESLKQQLEALLGSSGRRDFRIFINKDASLVTVRGTKRELDEVQRFLAKLTKRMHKQVLIEAKLIEVVYNDSQTVGIDWSKFNLSIEGSRDAHAVRQDGVSVQNFSVPNYFVGYNFSMTGLFDFLKKYGDVKVLSNPKILTLNNQPAIINVGDQLSYRYETTGYTTPTTTGNLQSSVTYAIGQSFIGITLYVIPEITEENEIIMKINPVTSELLSARETNNSTNRTLPPDMKIKQLTSIVKVKDGQKILIGGLISKNLRHDHNKVPLLGDVPVIGRLFHSTKKEIKKSELFILIVPKIIRQNNIPTIDEAAIFGGKGG